MHRSPNNAQNTQHKLGVAFSYLERNYFAQAVFFHSNLRFEKEKNFEETSCLQPRQFVYISLHLHLYANITVHPPDFAGDKNANFEFPNACLFGHPFYFGYEDFIS